MNHAQIKNRKWGDVGRALGKRGKDYRDRCVESQIVIRNVLIQQIAASNVFAYPTLLMSTRQLVVLGARNR